ncbi:DUF3265 domain-containing protein [Vibrio parahaemolyticus]|nr:DUF3265 domain-containing protein [Vibrio parahaemolyticus]MBE4354861.1 DUF3265 domain-containing protein [Vibrio parahaemolyticus]TOK64455.1 SMI1/KNR4 family protein [Vibrio parahaemolyticus]TON58068.1 SMI1/KNR4 family protein [Vibrio parahaemolyticus]
MHAAWHFWYAVGFGGESGLRELGLCGIHPLTQRYSFGVKMAFNLKEEQLVNTEVELGARLPHDYRESMKTDNGGEATTEEDDWELYPIKDNSDRKRLARTCNHIIAETKACFGFGNFPHHALAIASNGLGDQMVFLKESEQFKPEVYVWLHETGEIKLLASSFAKLEKL